MNNKIDRYNELSHIKNATNDEKEERCDLLQEIYYIGEFLKRRLIDALARTDIFDTDTIKLMPLSRWDGVANELPKYDPSPGVTGFSAEEKITRIAKTNNIHTFLPKSEVWIESNTEKKYFWSKKTISDNVKSVASDLKELNVKKPELDSSNEIYVYYYNKLYQFKDKLINTINFEQGSSAEIKSFRNLSKIVNREISFLESRVPSLIKRKAMQENYSKQKFAGLLENLSSEKMEQLIIMLKGSTPEKMLASFQEFEAFDIRVLGGVNNTNLKLTNWETGDQYVLRVETPIANQMNLRKLSLSSVNEFFIQDFFSSCPSDSNPYALVVSEFAEGGDLYSERKNKYAQIDDTKLTMTAHKRMRQLIKFCQALVENQCAHTDIKLTNFLVNESGELKVSDKKAIVYTNSNTELRRGDISVTTGIYNPPEFDSPRKTIINVEAYMVYQIGLALYDFLILPKIDYDNPEAKAWSQQALDFDKLYFNTFSGLKMRPLIETMTNSDPAMRPSLTELEKVLKEIDFSTDIAEDTDMKKEMFIQRH